MVSLKSVFRESGVRSEAEKTAEVISLSHRSGLHKGNTYVTIRIRVEEYVRPDGSCPYANWFNSLDAQPAAKVVTAKLRMELGNTSNVKWFPALASTSSIGVRAIGSISPRMANR